MEMLALRMSIQSLLQCEQRLTSNVPAITVVLTNVVIPLIGLDDGNMIAYSSTSQVTVASSVVGLQGFGGDMGIHHMPVCDTYASDSADTQSQPATNASTAILQLSQHNSPYRSLHAAQAPEDLEQPHGDLTYGPIPHASIQLANNMCFRTHQRTVVNHRSSPYSIVYRQERSRGPIYNGNIYGGVNLNMLNVDGAVLHYLKEHAATGAMHDSDERFPPPLCHPGTREAVIYRILDWYGYQRGPGKPIMWVYAPAGYGKTAVAGTVTGKLEEKLTELTFNPVGATFFFWRTSPERNSPARFIITLAYQLFISIPELAPHIENAVNRDPMILRKALEVQLKRLIIEPFKALGDTKDMPNRLIIIDGLDECINSDRESRVQKKYAEDQETVQIRVLDLIHALASHQLPISFLILSRPEAWIKQHIESQQFRDLVEFVDLHEVGDHLKDVETFVRAELSRLGLNQEDLVKRLVRQAGGHMLYASTVIRHLDCPYDDPRKRLQNFLDNHPNDNPDLAHSTPFSSLYELYRQILKSCPEGSRPVMIEVLEDILGAAASFNVRAVDMDRAVSTLDQLSGRVAGTGMKAIRGLHAVLNLARDARNDYMYDGPAPLEFFIHLSFRQFLWNPRLLPDLHIEPQKGCGRLLSGCLHYMSSITLDSDLDADHRQYVVGGWMRIWSEWMYQRPEKVGLLAMFQKLLNIDLMACFVHAFTHRQLDEFLFYPDIDSRILWSGPKNWIIGQTIDGHDFYHSELLAQQAVSHAIASCKAAIIHLLKIYQPHTNHYNPWFSSCLADLLPFSREPGSWNSDEVVRTLKELKRVSPEYFEELVDDVDRIIRSDLDFTVQPEGIVENYETFITFIRSDAD